MEKSAEEIEKNRLLHKLSCIRTDRYWRVAKLVTKAAPYLQRLRDQRLEKERVSHGAATAMAQEMKAAANAE